MRNREEIIERWECIYHDFKEGLPKYRKLYLDPVRNAKFSFTGTLSMDLLCLGKFEYLLNKNVTLFREHLTEATLLYQDLIEKYDQGKSVGAARVSMIIYQKLFHALATGDIALARNFSRHMGGRPDIEKEFDQPCIIDFGYTLKYFVEDADSHLKKASLAKFLAHCKTKMYSTFIGYAYVFEALLEKNLEKANKGFEVVVQGHEEECHGKGERFFQETVDEDICIWGIGLANLCRYNGLDVQIENPLIPSELLIPVSTRIS
jgi:hypothetical protein